MNNYLDKLNRMIDNINKINDDDKRYEYFYKISSYGSFIYYSGYISKDEFNRAMGKITNDPIEELYYKERNKEIYKLVANNDILDVFYYKILSLYPNSNINSVINHEISRNIYNEFIEFLKYVNFYSLYEELNNKHMISYTSNVLDYSICINNHDDSYIVMHENNQLNKYITLVHEIAHAFENRILKEKKKIFDTCITSEIISITFARIFIEYLNKNNVLKDNEINIIKHNLEINYLNFIKWSFLITESIKYNAFDINNYDINLYIKSNATTRSLTDHNYSLGYIASFSNLDKWKNDDTSFLKDLPDMIHVIDNMDLAEVIDFYDNMDLIKNNLPKSLVLKQ